MTNNTDTWTLKLRPSAFDLPRDEVEEEVDRMFEVGEFYVEVSASNLVETDD